MPSFLVRRLLQLANQGAAGLTFPYTFDPTGLSAFPAGWTAPTYTIAGNVISNSPTLGSELLTDPGLEAAYTGGLCGSISAATGGTPTEVTSGVHGGSKAQGWTPDGNFQSVIDVRTPTAQRWYKWLVYIKRTAGTGGKILTQLSQTMAGYSRFVTSASYIQSGAVVYTDNTDNLTSYYAIQGNGGFDTVVVDDASLKVITASSLFALVDAGNKDYTVKAR
jgi:hypothetical protein